MTIPRPTPHEYAPFYARYIERVPEGSNLPALLEAQAAELDALLGGLDETKALHRYAPGKWSIKEVVGHLADAERIMAYRLLRIARALQQQQPVAALCLLRLICSVLLILSITSQLDLD